jgi:hypothetical protein
MDTCKNLISLLVAFPFSSLTHRTNFNKSGTPYHYKYSVTGPSIGDDIVLGVSSFYTANRPILAVAALRYRKK